MSIERISLEVSNRCAKACAFCYAASTPAGSTSWTAAEIVAFAADCAAHGVRAISFGGGEPLQATATFDALRALDGTLFRSVTTNGLLLDAPSTFDALVDAQPDKVHVSIHFPDDDAEVARVMRQVHALAGAGIRSGVNLLVTHTTAASGAAQAVFARLVDHGITADRIVLLPMRGLDAPSLDDVAGVVRASGVRAFRSMTCLTSCGRSPRFASVSWDKRAGWCSYTTSKRALATLDHKGLVAALADLDVAPCVGAPSSVPGSPLTRIERRRSCGSHPRTGVGLPSVRARASAESDFPAAHSMDTDWWGIDDDGSIAFFHSGEEGAVPSGADLDRTRALVGDVCAPRGRDAWEAAFAGDDEPSPHHDYLAPYGGPVLLFPRHLDVDRHFAAELLAGNVRVIANAAGGALTIDATNADILARLAFLHEVGACAGCYGTENLAWRIINTRDELMALFGVHVYSNWNYDPTTDYRRDHLASAPPIHVDDLAANVVDEMFRLKGTRFASMEWLHPADYVACRTYRDPYSLEPGWRPRPTDGGGKRRRRR